MAKFINRVGCTIEGDIDNVSEIDTERMGDGWRKVEEDGSEPK